jgi:hypothetical protein
VTLGKGRKSSRFVAPTTARQFGDREKERAMSFMPNKSGIDFVDWVDQTSLSLAPYANFLFFLN